MIRPAVREPAERAWAEELLRTPILIMGVVGGALLVSPLMLFPTGGVFPTAGAILIAFAAGSAWSRHTRLRGNRMIALGAGIAMGAILTDWSGLTNGLFLLGGLVVATVGFGINRRAAEHRRRGYQDSG